MILSFHPCIDADLNAIVAGRPPGPEEESMVKKADAIILPQGVRQDLYDLCRKYSTRVFPNYDLRFQNPGKIGDIVLFRSAPVLHPETFLFQNVRNIACLFPFLLWSKEITGAKVAWSTEFAAPKRCRPLLTN